LNKTYFDIIIVGGGLAGLTLSIQIVDAGYTVALFEKEQYPFHKVCGEYISMESYDFLKRCGIPLDEWELPKIDKLQLTDCSGKLYEFLLPLGGFGISRYKLDSSLVEIARRKGVMIFDAAKVDDVRYDNDNFIVTANSNIYHAHLVAGTFGKRSNLDIKWNRDFISRKRDKSNTYLGVKYHIIHDHDAATIALHNFENGYCGISKIEENKSCLCYLTTAKNLSISNNSIDQMEKKILYKNKVLADIFNTSLFIYEKPITISQISFDPKSKVENHVLMIGDAAGLITPLCGNGMSMAMHASYLAFQVIHSFFRNEISREELEKRYQSVWNQSFYARLTIGRVIQRCFGNPFLTRYFLQFMSRFPLFANWLIKKTHGKAF